MRFGSEQMDQYMALSKKDLQINITLNELYNTQSLLIQHLDVLVRAVLSLSFLPARLCTRRLTSPPACSLARQAPNDKQHLRILLEELGPAPAQVPRKENRAVELPLYSRWEMPIQDITTALMAENNVTQNDILYLEAKSIFVQLIRSLPRLAERRPIQLPVVAETAATAKDATLVRKGIKVKEMLRELEELRLVDRRDGYKLLTDEVAAELAHLGNLREKVVSRPRASTASTRRSATTMRTSGRSSSSTRRTCRTCARRARRARRVSRAASASSRSQARTRRARARPTPTWARSSSRTSSSKRTPSSSRPTCRRTGALLLSLPL